MRVRFVLEHGITAACAPGSPATGGLTTAGIDHQLTWNDRISGFGICFQAPWD